MTTAPTQALLAATREYAIQFRPKAVESTAMLRLPHGEIALPQFDFSGSRVVLVEASEGQDLVSVATDFRSGRPASFDDLNVYSITVAVAGEIDGGSLPVVLERGIKIAPLHLAIGEIVRLPQGWRDAQLRSTLQALQTVDQQPVPIRAIVGEDEYPDACAWLTSRFSWSDNANALPIYLRAEAGKGKSTVLAQYVRQQLRSSVGPLPLLVSLRELQRGGVSWEQIAASLGVVGTAVADLASAVRAGLVALVLDGLDEIAGRYDPNLVMEVSAVVFRGLVTEKSLIVMSGRTTESALIAADDSVVKVGLELPETSSSAFSDYVSRVLDDVIRNWSKDVKHAATLPLGDVSPQPGLPIAEHERDAIYRWIQYVFDDYGKDRSLFFVQSLAFIGRRTQLNGNSALVIEDKQRRTVAQASLQEVSVIAAARACLREQEKIEEIGRSRFLPSRQLDALMWLALAASAGEGSLRSQLGRVNELVQRAFRIDSVNDAEEFTSILRQIQKHALLYSATGGDERVGDWQPAFLSDWVRGAFLVRAWARSTSEPKGELIRKIVARADRAHVAYSHLFAEAAFENDSLLKGLLDELVKEADLDSPEACSNFWSLLVSVNREQFARVGPQMPRTIVTGSDLSDLEIAGLDLGKGFSADFVYFGEARFVSCLFGECSFRFCDFESAVFTGCRFRDVLFHECDGTVYFDNCVFEGCRFEEVHGRDRTGWLFIDCEFVRGNSILQDSPMDRQCIGRPWGCASFSGCSMGDSGSLTLIGVSLGLSRGDVQRATVQNSSAARSREWRCLAAIVKPFFPVRAGAGNYRQVRPYIRISSIGRGVLPPDAPSTPDLISVLEGKGFARGGRVDHLFGPWSPLSPKKDSADIKGQLLAFLRDGTQGAEVQAMLKKIRSLRSSSQM